MKTLTIYPYESFDIDNGVTLFESTNAQLIWKLSQFFNGIPNEFAVLSESNKPINVNKVVTYVGDLTTFPNLNIIFGKKIINHFIDHCDSDLMRNIQLEDAKIKSQVMQTIFNNDLPFQITESFDINQLLKYLNLSISDIEYDSVYDIIINIVDIANRMSDNSLYVFINARYYLYDEQLISLANEAKIKEVSILLVSLTFDKVMYDVAGSDVVSYFIDDDFVDFRSDDLKK